MDNILLKINALYNEMGKAEKKVADFLFKNPQAIIPLSINELAEKCGSGEATIVRFSRRLGLSGYQDLKIALAKESDAKPINEKIEKDDAPDTVFKKVCSDIYSSLEKTQAVLKPDVFEGACKALLSAKKILIFGLGNSASVASDMAHKLIRLGINASAYSDNHMQAITASHADASCAVVGISHSGSSKDIIDALKIAKSNGATTISITNNGKSPIYGVSDFVLATVADETNYSVLGLASRISQLAIIDTIYYYAVCQIENAEEKMNSTVSSLSSKKY